MFARKVQLILMCHLDMPDFSIAPLRHLKVVFSSSSNQPVCHSVMSFVFSGSLLVSPDVTTSDWLGSKHLQTYKQADFFFFFFDRQKFYENPGWASWHGSHWCHFATVLVKCGTCSISSALFLQQNACSFPKLQFPPPPLLITAIFCGIECTAELIMANSYSGQYFSTFG